MAYLDSVLSLPSIRNIGPATARVPQPKRAWPEGTVLVSSDSHFLEGDIWHEKFPVHLREQAPRVLWEDNAWSFRFGADSPKQVTADKTFCELTECVPGIGDLEARLKDLDTEGVAKELLFPQKILSLHSSGITDLRQYTYPIYNEFMAEVCAKAPGRLYFVALPNFWDLTQSRASIDRIRELGASGILLPRNGRHDVHGDPIYWGHPKMAPFWEAVEESGLPVTFHVGEGLPNPYPGAGYALAVCNFADFTPIWTQITFGGLFDRHPGLKVVFVEAGGGWVPKILHDADYVFNTMGPVSDYRIAHDPSYYWFQNCYATFMVDPIGLKLLDDFGGADRFMWSTDYPHAESTLGFTQDTVQAVFDAVDVETAQKILGGTAIKLFNMS